MLNKAKLHGHPSVNDAGRWEERESSGAKGSQLPAEGSPQKNRAEHEGDGRMNFYPLSKKAGKPSRSKSGQVNTAPIPFVG
ncbi:hypothetical protein ABE38_18035 [Brevibacillus agri]|nr:hypothetical protein [Brevibacillus agri]